MRLRAFVPIATVVAGIVAWSVHSPAQPPAAELLPHPAKSASHIQGTGGCAAAGCHAAPLAAGKAGTEYSTWIHDPHSKAAGNRNLKPYQDVLTRLRGAGYTEELCLKCHATPTPDGSPLAKDLLDDGIGCESCHGPAEKWRTEHYRNSWKSLTAKQKELEYDFFPTKDLGRRIEKCAECHVGNESKDVNHDLIAAGHPRLTFEYTAYHELLPRHWRDKVSEAEDWEKADPKKMQTKFGPDFEAKAWLAGQAATAKAAVELTAARAKAAGQPTHPWPEFTEYGCFACHHDLKPKQDGNLGSTWRQGSRYDKIPPGALPWATWARPGVEGVSRVSPTLAPPGGDPFADLAVLLSQSSPDPKLVAAKATPAIGRLTQWRDAIATAPPLDAAGARKTLAGIAADGLAHSPRDWDDAASHYLAMAAIYQALTEFDKSADTPARRDLFIKLRNVLAFPNAGKSLRNSPADFTPEKYKAALQPFATEFKPGRAMIVTPLRAVAVGLLALCAVPFFVPTISRGQPPAGAPSPHADVFSECYRCHFNGPTPIDKRNGADKFLRLTESSVWENQDLHAKAVESLKGDLGQRMGELLYHDKDVTKRPECLACHAVDLSVTPGRPGHGQNLNDFYRDNGVSCEACHGVATEGDKNKDWLEQHRRSAWRKLLPAEKTAKGLIDMRSPEARAERCAACHVGNATEGKFVTHAMYAAGHPPLPPLETLTYSRDQPTHAIAPEKNKYISEDVNADDAWKLFHVRKDESSSARQAAVGAAVGFREGMKTLADAADDAAKNNKMLDFALFDCAACHHDLIAPSWRQERGFVGTPGRPLPRTGPTTLLRTVAGGDSGGFDGKFAALVKATNVKPFGDPAAIAPAARELANWSDGVAKSLDQSHYDAARTTQLKRDLADAGRRKPGRGLDYDDAQQLLWAFDALKDEGTPVSPEVAAELAKLAGPEPDKPMQGRLWEEGKWEPGKRPLIATLLPDRLRKASQYRPETFWDAFDRIAAGLK